MSGNAPVQTAPSDASNRFESPPGFTIRENEFSGKTDKMENRDRVPSSYIQGLRNA
jgi:hypothetical protein